MTTNPQTRSQFTKWPDEKEAQLRALWSQGITGSGIAKLLKTTRSAVLAKANRLRLEARDQPPEWTEHETAKLRALYPTSMPRAEAARCIGRTKGACKRRASRLGLTRQSAARAAA